MEWNPVGKEQLTKHLGSSGWKSKFQFCSRKAWFLAVSFCTALWLEGRCVNSISGLQSSCPFKSNLDSVFISCSAAKWFCCYCDTTLMKRVPGAGTWDGFAEGVLYFIDFTKRSADIWVLCRVWMKMLMYLIFLTSSEQTLTVICWGKVRQITSMVDERRKDALWPAQSSLSAPSCSWTVRDRGELMTRLMSAAGFTPGIKLDQVK